MRLHLVRLGLAVAASAALIGGAIAQGQKSAAMDARSLIECVSTKAGPEGDLPPPGALRTRMLKEMEGGTQACIGLIRRACVEAGGDHQACSRRETAGWLEALKRDDPNDNRKANIPRWNAGVKNIRGQAGALCQGAAALSAWGYETVRSKGSYSTEDLSGCIMEAVAQQSLIMLVHVRGN